MAFLFTPLFTPPPYASITALLLAEVVAMNVLALAKVAAIKVLAVVKVVAIEVLVVVKVVAMVVLVVAEVDMGRFEALMVILVLLLSGVTLASDWVDLAGVDNDAADKEDVDKEEGCGTL